MTTLPQTSLRLPRSSPAMQQLAVPAGAPVPFLAQGAAPPLTGADIWRVIRANMWLIITFLILSIIGGYVAYKLLYRYHPKFEAVGIVQVNPPLQLDPLKSNSAEFNINVLALDQKNNAQSLKDQALYSQVLQNEGSPIRDTDWLKRYNGDTSLAKQDLMDNLLVTAVPETTQIRVEFATRDPRDAEKIVQSVVDEQIIRQSAANARYQDQRRQQLTSRKQGLDQQRGELEGSIREREVSLNINGVSGSGNLMLAETTVNELTRDKTGAEQRYRISEEQETLLKQQLAAGQDPPLVVDAVDRDPQVLRYSDMVTNYEANLLGQKGDMGPNNKVMDNLNLQYNLYVKKLQDAQENVRVSKRDQLIQDAEEEVKATKLALDGINQNIAAAQTTIQSLNTTMREYSEYRDQLAGLQSKEKAIDDELDQINQFTNQKDQTNLEWRSLPEASDIPIFPKLSATMAMSVALGLMFSLCIAFAREFLDTTVRSPRDITRVGNMTVLGMIPHEDDDPQSRGTRLPLVIFEAPQSMMAEQLRQVRTRLQHAASLDTTRTILITSPGPDDGKSTIAANLASGLALNGRRILLVDANFRRPSVHRMFNLANDVGFSDVLNKLDVFETALQQTQVPNLYVLPSGLKPTNATELLESQLLVDFIERALEEFDHVIFDSGPLLFVSETVALAPRVDGVVTVVRARANSRGLLQRMRDSLRQIKAEHLGVVLNAVRSQGGGYYRSNIRTYYDYQNGRAA